MVKVTRRFALWQADLDGGVCAVPEECVDTLREREHIRLVIEHRVHGGAPATRVFETSLRQDVEWQFVDIAWPPDLRPGVLVTVSWQAAKDEVMVRTAALEEPMRVDGVDYFHEYDPRVVTREFAAGGSNRGQVLHAVRRLGRVYSDGSAVFAESGLAASCGLGRGARGSFLLRNAVDQLIREGYLTRVPGSVDGAGYPCYPAAARPEGRRAAVLLAAGGAGAVPGRGGGRRGRRPPRPLGQRLRPQAAAGRAAVGEAAHAPRAGRRERAGRHRTRARLHVREEAPPRRLTRVPSGGRRREDEP
nr:hypothetical protein GCM10020092_066620 [Actinoplanes digitatis]